MRCARCCTAWVAIASSNLSEGWSGSEHGAADLERAGS